MARSVPALRTLVDAASADGAVRSDPSIDDFYQPVNNAPHDQPPTVPDRWIDLILYGLTGPTPR